MTAGVWSDAAVWIGPTPNETPGAMSTVLGVVLHIQQGTEAGTEAWQRNPAARVSSHFTAPKSGGLRQMVPVTDKAWCEVAGNSHWLSIECEGRSGDTLTPDQIHSCAVVLAKAHIAFGVPLTICDNPTPASVSGGGLGYHAMGGNAWGGHFNCPGAPIIAQRSVIITAAQNILGISSTGGTEMLSDADIAAIFDHTVNGVRLRDILGREDSFNRTVVSQLTAIQATLTELQAGVTAIPTTQVALTDAQVANIAAGLANRHPVLTADDEPTIRAAVADVLRSAQG